MSNHLVWNGSRAVNYYALTFDDGPYRLPIGLWLDVLEAEGAVGTFFFTGEWMDRFPEQAKEIIRRGHALAPHSYHHRRMSEIPKDVFLDELKMAELAYQEATGLPSPLYMRFPYCNFNDECLTWIGEFGYYDIEGTDSGDWAGIPSEEITKKLIPELGNGMIAVMHSNDIAVGTRGALKPVIDAANGLDLIPVTMPIMMEASGLPITYRSWKLIVEVPSAVDHPPMDWRLMTSEDEIAALAQQALGWGINRSVDSPTSIEGWRELLGQNTSASTREWLGARSFSDTYWGFAKAYERGDCFVIDEHGAKEAQADTLTYLLRWAALQAAEAGLTHIEVRHDIRRMLRICEQLGWNGEIVPLLV